MLQTNMARYKYNPNEMSEDEFLKRFVVRKAVFDEVFEALQSADYSVPNQHHILIGQRGQGKTTILRKLSIEIQKDKKLSKFLIPVQFSEEQYSMRGLCSLWERVAEYLEDHYGEMFEDALENVESHEDDDNYEMKCFSYLEKQLKQHKKKLVLFIDNINILLESLQEQEQHHLREILLTSSSFIIVGGSTKMFEQQYEYSKPFYEFFNSITLDGLTFDESIALLRILGDKEQTNKIEHIIKNNPARIETLRRVTGGVPRTMVMLFEIFIEDNGNTFNDLMKVLDDVTPLYQERMNHIPKVLQNITHAIAINWDGMLTKEIAQKTKLESKVVSAQLKQLEKYQIVESVSIGKNKIYTIKERFFNIWYLMRFGKKKDRQRVEWLIQFLLAWYSRDELEDKAKKFINTLKTSDMNESYAYHLGEALSYVGVGLQTEYNLKQEVKIYLEKVKSSFVKEVSPSDVEILKKAFNFHTQNKLDEAINVLIKSKKNSSMVSNVIASLLYEQKEYKKAEEYYLKAIESGDTDALNGLSWYYFERSIKKEKALRYIKENYTDAKNYYNIHTFAVIELWLENFSKSYEKFLEWLEYGELVENDADVSIYLNLLISKGQLYKAKEFLEMPEYQLKERYKPIWYALMRLMQDDFPHEIKKMGSELKDTVDEVLEEIERLRVKYALV